MLELRRGALAAAAALLILTVGVSKSFAVESSSFTNTLGGASVGVPAAQAMTTHISAVTSATAAQ